MSKGLSHSAHVPRYTMPKESTTSINFTENGILLYLTDDTASNMTAWIPGRNTVVIINKYTIIKAHPSHFEFQENNNIIPSHIPDFINLPSCPQEGAEPNQEGAKPPSLLPQEGVKPKLILSQEEEGSPPNNFQNQKLCSISPVIENSKNCNPAEFPYVF